MDRIYGVFKGNHINENTNNSVSQTDIATQMGISVDTLQNYKTLSEMIPELEELLNHWSQYIVEGENNFH